MKRIALAALAATLLGGTALADGLPENNAPPPVVVQQAPPPVVVQLPPPVVTVVPPVVVPPVVVPPAPPPVVVAPSPPVCGVNTYCPPPINAPPSPPPAPVCVVTGAPWEWLNIRSVPNGPILTSVAPGTPLTLFNTSGRWGYVQTPFGVTGWAFLPYTMCH